MLPRFVWDHFSPPDDFVPAAPGGDFADPSVPSPARIWPDDELAPAAVGLLSPSLVAVRLPDSGMTFPPKPSQG